ncbi:hypothetical protein EJB05_50775, partial [Eragrostis curvula]
MANAILQNPIVVEVMDNLNDLLVDVDHVQEVLDAVRAGIAENAALYAEATAELAQASRRLVEAVIHAHDAAARRAPPESAEGPEDPEVIARAAAYLELEDLVRRLSKVKRTLLEALAFILMVRAAAYFVAREHLIPGVLLTAAAAYAVAYVASGGAVVPGAASLLRISALVLCFLFGVRG